MEDYKEKYELGSIVTATRTFNRETITGEFGGFYLLDKSNPKSIVGVVNTPNGSYDVEPNSIKSVINKDEKIRKELWEYFHNLQLSSDCNFSPSLTIDDILSWLEKQGEQINIENKEYWRGYREGKQEILDKYAELEKQCEKKSKELPNGEDYGIDSLYHAARILEKTLGNVEGYQSDDGILEHKCAIEAVNRLYKQKPAEWSEEDERMLNSIVGNLNNGEWFDIYQADWLRSLKDRAQPHTWKPSEKQMQQLGWVAEQNIDNVLGKELMSLYQDLKKLKEE